MLRVSVRSGRLRRPGDAVPTAGGKRGQGHRMVPFPPLDSLKPSFKPRRPSVARLNESYGDSVPCVGQVLGGCYALNFPCVIRRAQQCAARQCRALD